MPRAGCKRLADQMSARDFSLQLEKNSFVTVLTDSCGIKTFERLKFEYYVDRFCCRESERRVQDQGSPLMVFGWRWASKKGHRR